jgi:hypothetical protein
MPTITPFESLCFPPSIPAAAVGSEGFDPPPPGPLAVFVPNGPFAVFEPPTPLTEASVPEAPLEPCGPLVPFTAPFEPAGPDAVPVVVEPGGEFGVVPAGVAAFQMAIGGTSSDTAAV